MLEKRGREQRSTENYLGFGEVDIAFLKAARRRFMVQQALSDIQEAH